MQRRFTRADKSDPVYFTRRVRRQGLFPLQRGYLPARKYSRRSFVNGSTAPQLAVDAVPVAGL